MITWILKSLWPDNDPVRGCDVYKDKNSGSCVHVDGPLCDYPQCTVLKDYRECAKQSDCVNCNNTPVGQAVDDGPPVQTLKTSGAEPWLYQYRFYENNPYVDERCHGWQEWVTCTPEKLIDIRQYINWGKRYQIRSLLEQHAEGFDPLA